jgi:LysR family transcriptional regulator (chromosome initiation inhibitor)
MLVVREKPCGATAAGVPLLRLAAQTALLEADALAEMGGTGLRQDTRITVAVNANSMATWFTAVFDGLSDVLSGYADRRSGPFRAAAARGCGDGGGDH